MKRNAGPLDDCDFKVRSSTSLSPDVKKMSAVSILTNGASSEAAMAPLNNISAGRESLKARTYALQIPTKGILARNEVE